MMTTETVFQRAFKLINENAKGALTIIGDCLVVEEIPKEEVKTKSGIVLAGGPGGKVTQMDGIEANRPIFCRVLAVGEGYYKESGETVPLDTKVDDILLVSRLSVKWLSHLGPLISTPESQLGLIPESEVRYFKFEGQDGYDRVCRILSEIDVIKEGNR